MRNFTENTKNENQELLTASRSGNLVRVTQTLNAGANINFHDEEGYTALHLAVYYGHENIVKELLNNGANITFKLIAGDTIFDIAA
jgi:ankyrin repeat protein